MQECSAALLAQYSMQSSSDVVELALVFANPRHVLSFTISQEAPWSLSSTSQL